MKKKQKITNSVSVAFRVTPEVHKRAREIAEKSMGMKKVNDVARDIFLEYFMSSQAIAEHTRLSTIPPG